LTRPKDGEANARGSGVDRQHIGHRPPSLEFDSSASTMPSASAMRQVGQTPTGLRASGVHLHTHAAWYGIQ